MQILCKGNMAIFVLIAIAPGISSAQTIECLGTKGGGTGIIPGVSGTRDYVYMITHGPDPESYDSTFIGTHDPDINNYFAISLPTGWTFQIIQESRNDYCSGTPHGGVSAGPTGQCPYTMLFLNFTGTPATLTYIGFNHACDPHDVDWKLAGFPPATANWSAPVGNGVGPVHAPLNPCMTNTILLNSGYDMMAGGIYPVGAPNAYWTLFVDPDPDTYIPRPTFAIAKNNSWQPALPNSQWISSKNTDIYQIVGTFGFEYKFCLENCFNSIALDLHLRADDSARVYLNGTLIGAAPYPSHTSPAPTQITVTNPALFNFLPAPNYLTIEVQNIGFPAMGLNVVGTVTTDTYALLDPWCCDSTGMICGTKWHDADQNGVMDLSEAVLPNWQMNTAVGIFITTALTDNLGVYCLCGIPPGPHAVYEDLSAVDPCWGQTFPPQPGIHNIVTGIKDVVLDVDFGNDTCVNLHIGNVDGDTDIDALDVNYLINYVAQTGPNPIPQRHGDVNGDCCIDKYDVVYLDAYVTQNPPGSPAPVTCTCCFPPFCGGSIDSWCGDPNGDDDINLSDAVYLIGYIFKSGPPPHPLCTGDVNGDDDVNIGDAVSLINYIFKGGPPPEAGCCP